MRGSLSGASAAGSNRRQPARSARTATTRPSNYYARPLGHQANTAAPADDGPDRSNPPGFFPAITHFTDGLAALPKEVMRHFTLIKETEGKAYLPDQDVVEILDAISKLPQPLQELPMPHNQPYLGFSLSNSVNGSAPGSMIDGNVPPTKQALPDIDEAPHVVNEQVEMRRVCFAKLREGIKAMLNVLDEKNMVLSSANDTLARHLTRLDGTLPHVESEISEEARLGSNTHWALSHMKEQRKGTGPAANDRSRRDVQAANSLALAAAAVHEGDIAATRSEARREAVQAKRRNLVDSDFDERPPAKRSLAGTKARKTHEAAAGVDGKTAQPHKRRRVDKALAPGMERSASGAPNGRPGAGSHRDAAGEGPARKRNKPLPGAVVQRKRPAAANSPSIASSPTRGTFATTTNKDLPLASSVPRAANPRARQNSAAKSAAQESTRSRPASALPSAGPLNGAYTDATAESRDMPNAGAETTGAPAMTAEGRLAVDQGGMQGAMAADSTSASGTLKREETEPAEGPEFAGALAQASRADMVNNSRVDGGTHASKPDAPVERAEPADGGTGMARSRSTRGWNGNGASRGGAAGYSPATRAADEVAAPRRTQKKTPKAYAESTRSSLTPPLAEGIAATVSQAARPNSNAAPSRGEYNSVEDDDEGGPLQADDGYVSSDEPRYCFCNGPSYGHMIGCDNEECPREWFHLACVGLAKPPGGKAKWFCCDECRETGRTKEQQRKR